MQKFRSGIAGVLQATAFGVVALIGGTPVQAQTVPLSLSPARGLLEQAWVQQKHLSVILVQGGVTPLTCEVSGGLPPGMTANPIYAAVPVDSPESHGGCAGMTIGGSATVSGSYTFDITVTDAENQIASGTYFLTVGTRPLTISLPTFPEAVVGDSYGIQGSVFAGQPPYEASITTGTLPPGLTLATRELTDGTLLLNFEGTPTTAGRFEFAVEARSSSGDRLEVATASSTIIVHEAPGRLAMFPRSGSLASIPLGQDFSQPLTITAGTAPYRFEVTDGTVPLGMAINIGVCSVDSSVCYPSSLAGRPQHAGRFNFSITATDANGSSVTEDYTLEVLEPPALGLHPRERLMPQAISGLRYSQTLANASGGVYPYTAQITSGTLPAGLTLQGSDPGGNANYWLSGTPVEAGEYVFTLTVTDARGTSVSGQYALNVAAAPSVFSIVPSGGPLPPARLGEPYEKWLATAGGAGLRGVTLTGDRFPSGIRINPTRDFIVLDGIAAEAGEFSFTLTATDNLFNTASETFTLTVLDAETVCITSGALPDGTLDVVYSLSALCSGDPGTFRISLSAGELPPGLVLESSGTISGVPTAPGTYAFAAHVYGQNGVLLRQGEYTITIVSAATAFDESLVQDFVAARGVLLAGGIRTPSLRDRNVSGPGEVSVTPSGNALFLNFATSSAQLSAWNAAGDAATALAGRGVPEDPINFWIDGSITLHVRGGAQDERWGSFALLSAGVDYKASEALLLGVALHLDMMEDIREQATHAGRGMLAGPYLSAQLADHLYFDAGVYFGQSWNDVTQGLFSGTFGTARLLAKARLEGEMALDDRLVLRPDAEVSYLREETLDYMLSDSAGGMVTAAGFTSELLQLSAGGGLENRFSVLDALLLAPYLGARLGLDVMPEVSTAFAAGTLGIGLSAGGAWTADAELGVRLTASGHTLSARGQLRAGF